MSDPGKMQQFQKGYSVLENIPEEKEADGVGEPRPKLAKHEILWYWFIFTLIVTLVFIWAFVLLHLQQVWNQDHATQSRVQILSRHSKNRPDFWEDPNPTDILGALQEKDVIRGEAWKAWSIVEDSVSQHICKIDNGVSDSGMDFVVKRFDIVTTVSTSDSWSTVWVDQSWMAPQGLNVTGLIALDIRRNGSGDTCNLDALEDGSFPSVRLTSRTPPALSFTFLVIGRMSGSGSGEIDGIHATHFSRMIIKQELNRSLEKEVNSDEEFNDYVY